jgi:secreted trypsin-like serine protease
MRKLLCALLAVAAVTVVAVGGASAITNGRPDGGMHPYVGLMVAQDADGVPLWRCSGSLISPTVFLTAGHCTEAPAAHMIRGGADSLRSGLRRCTGCQPNRRRLVQRLG